jgi:hypothetical protein
MSRFPFDNSNLNLPLSEFPYNSRVEATEFQTTLGGVSPSKNYVMVAFRPGFPLQASELNEMQEISNVNSSLTTSMMHYWTIPLQDVLDINMPPTSLPGWLGAIPLFPEKTLSSEEFKYNGDNLVYYSGGIVHAKKGWYYVYMNTSGLKHWIYLNQDLQSPVITPSSQTQYIGFKCSYSYIGPSTDSSLYDNSNTNISSGTPAGANRVTLNILELTLRTNTQENLFSPMVKINSTFTGIAQYINNRPIPTGP